MLIDLFSQNIASLKLYAGDTWKFSMCPELYPVDTYTLKVYFKRGANEPIEFTSANQDGSHYVLCDSSKTKDVVPGINNLVIKAVNKNDDTDITTLLQTSIPIYPDITTESDTTEYWQKVLELAKESFERLISRDTDEVTVMGDTYRYTEREKLLKLIKQLETKANVESGNYAGFQQHRVMFS